VGGWVGVIWRLHGFYGHGGGDGDAGFCIGVVFASYGDGFFVFRDFYAEQ
jgi:hypothetical protein